MSLEGKSPEEIQALAAISDELLADPKYGMAFKRLVKAQNPNASVPDVELEQRVAAELGARDKEITDLKKNNELNAAERQTNALYEALRDAGAVTTRDSFVKLCEYANKNGFMVNETGLKMAARHKENEEQAAEPTPMNGIREGFELGEGEVGKSFMKDPAGTARTVAAKAMDELKNLRNKGGARATH